MTVPPLLAALAMSATSTHPAYAQAPVTELAGCYAIDIGVWEPPVELGDDTVEVQPPARVALLADRGTASFESRGHLVRPVPGTEGSTHRWSYWRRLAPDSIYIAWTTGFAGLRMHLGVRDSILVGEAQTFWDFPREPQTAPATLRRVRCP
jgi:hypothetical protein